MLVNVDMWLGRLSENQRTELLLVVGFDFNEKSIPFIPPR